MNVCWFRCLFPLPILLLLVPAALSAVLPGKGRPSEGHPQWLDAHLDDEITAEQLAKLFGGETGTMGMMAANKGGLAGGNGTKRPEEFAYSDAFVRNKILVLAAGAYGADEMTERCLKKRWTEAKLYRHIVVPCNGHKGEHCAGYLALLPSERAIVLAFRGTSSYIQLLLEIGQTVSTWRKESPIGGKVASYFHEIFQQLLAEGLMDDLGALVRANPDHEIWITGHSLGGALASLAAAEVHTRKLIGAEQIKLVTLGQPRTGNSEYTRAMDEALPFYNYRVVHSRDVVAHVPPRYFEDYHHHRTEVGTHLWTSGNGPEQIWYKNGMSEAETDYVQCDETAEDDKNCSNQIYVWNVRDHVNYFGKRVDHYGRIGCEDS